MPGRRGGVTQEMLVGVMIVYEQGNMPPRKSMKRTVVPGENPVPVIMMVVAVNGSPQFGTMLLMAGVGLNVAEAACPVARWVTESVASQLVPEG